MKISNLLTLLKVGADVKLTKEQAQYLTDLIEQQQYRIAELEATNKALEQNRDQYKREAYALAATVERLREVVTEYHDENIACEEALNELWEIHRKNPHQNLNAVKREVYADGFYQGFSDAWCSNFDWEQDHVHYGLEQSVIRAEQEYPSSRDGE